MKIANAKVIRDFRLKELVADATERLRPLEYRVLGLPKEKELMVLNTIKNVLKDGQTSGNNKGKAVSVDPDEP